MTEFDRLFTSLLRTMMVTGGLWGYGLPREKVAEEAGITPGGMLSKMPTALVERVVTLDELFG